jgi:hypothetical protein
VRHGGALGVIEIGKPRGGGIESFEHSFDYRYDEFRDLD